MSQTVWKNDGVGEVGEEKNRLYEWRGGGVEEHREENEREAFKVLASD